MGWASRAIGVILLFVAATQAVADFLPFPERGRSVVVDAAGVIPDGAEAVLDARLVAWNRSTGHQLVVATVPSLQGREIEDYAIGLLRHWGLGRAGTNDGVILLLAPNERKVRIEVGYGLEGVLTDARSNRIIGEAIRPSLRAGDVVGALTAGSDGIMRTITSGADEALPARPAHDASTLSWWWILLGSVGCVIVAVFLYPIFELWFTVWPFYLLMPARAKRAEARHRASGTKRDSGKAAASPARRAGEGAETERESATQGRRNNLSTVGAMAESMRARLRQQRSRYGQAPRPSGGDALEAFRDLAQDALVGSVSEDLSDFGFDGGGGSGGGGGAGSDY